MKKPIHYKKVKLTGKYGLPKDPTIFPVALEDGSSMVNVIPYCWTSPDAICRYNRNFQSRKREYRKWQRLNHHRKRQLSH